MTKYLLPTIVLTLWLIQLRVNADDIANDIFKEVDPSVVAIQHERAGGSGFIVSEDGYILTNGHVVNGGDGEDPTKPAKSITVILNDETRYKAKVVGHSLDPDVALIKIEPNTKLLPVKIGDAEKIKIGEKVFAVGMPFGLKRTFTSGIISNDRRTDLGTYTWVLQTDAAINPGNSGGPLFNQQGEVIGLNTYGGGGNNLGFTVPINVALVMKDNYLKHGRFRRAALPYMQMGEINDEMKKAFGVDGGVLVHYVMPGTKAEKDGFRLGDVIVELNGAPVKADNHADFLSFRWKLVSMPVDTRVAFKVMRRTNDGHETVTIESALEEDEPMPRGAGRNIGEIPETRIDVLGIGFRRMVRIARLMHKLDDAPGVWVTWADGSLPAGKAGLRAGDMIVEVEGQPVTTPDEFEAAIERHLTAKKEHIVIRFMRQKEIELTAIKPYYDIKDKKIALIAPDADGEYVKMVYKTLFSDGANVTIATPSGNPVDLGGGESLNTNSTIETLDPEAFDAVIVAGGDGAEGLWENRAAIDFVQKLFGKKKTVCAYGAGVLVLANAGGKLLEKKLTAPEKYSKILGDKNAKYTGKTVERDEKVITGNGFDKAAMRSFLSRVRLSLR